MAALIVDASEDLREREESSLEQLLAGSRILVSAVSHEIRNVCGAIAIIYENLSRTGMLRGTQDFEALGSLVETLHKIAALELKQSGRDAAANGLDLHDWMSDLRIVLEPYCEDSGIEIAWDIPEGLPPAWADPHSLMQVFLNLTKNSQRALENAEEKRIRIAARARDERVTVSFSDSGPGIVSIEKMFQPFQRGAESTGLGLYLSRAFLRSFGGDLQFVPSAAGCTFLIELALANGSGQGQRDLRNATDTALVGR